jgi:diguanylate cyclase (GGDEF)-like protein/PAS domain S-box-containing protein
MHGLGALQALRDEGYTLPVIVLDGGADKATIIQLMKLGVDEVLQVPTVADDQVLSAVHHALETDAKNRMQRSEACALNQRFASLCPREQEFRNMAESSPDAIMRYDREGRILYLNQKLYRDLGVTQAELIGKTTGEVWSDNRFADIAQAVMRAIGSGEATTVELSHPLATGESICSQIRVVAERDAAGRIVGALAFGREITAVREAERKLRHFVDSLPGLAFTFRLSPDGHASFPFVSSAIEEIYGLRPEDVKDDMAPLHNLAHPDDRPRIEATIAESARTMAPFRVEFRVCRPGLPERWIDARSVADREADGGILWYGLMLDITERNVLDRQLAERKRVEEELRALQAELREQTIRDPLTGLYNRRYLDETLRRELARAERNGHPLNILMVDVDHFKQLNDTYGHPAGDEVLRLLGGLLQNHARSSDIPCRYGGEEFVLVLPDMSPEAARERAELVRRDFADLRIAFGGTEIAATLSIGVSSYPGHGKTADELIRAADLALYEAKQSGRNRVRYAGPSDVG